MTVAVRPAGPGDVADIPCLVRALAAHGREPGAAAATGPMLGEAPFGPGAHVRAHVAEADGRVLGVALRFPDPTWASRPGDPVVEEGGVRRRGGARCPCTALPPARPRGARRERAGDGLPAVDRRAAGGGLAAVADGRRPAGGVRAGIRRPTVRPGAR